VAVFSIANKHFDGRTESHAMAARLRTGSPSVFCRVTERGVLLDLRTVSPDAMPDLVRAVRYALEGDDLPDD